MTNYFVIIPAAGVGVRMKADRPKQYLNINGEPLLQRVINIFSNISQIKKIVVVLHAKDVWWSTLTIKNPNKLLTTIGGKERVDSVLLGLKCLQDIAKPNDFILTHDAARPFITEKNILTLLAEIENHPAGGLLGMPVVDTLKRVDENDCVQETVSREHLWHAQTPQCFRYQLLVTAIKKALSDHKKLTDESGAIEYAGHHPKMILGDSRNKKVTFIEDLK
ncbi:MAG: 2-C-methyl-D-erythritol 4-phosphate cytidylyltransferase [Gammaproteobacteria bacterium RIFCSPHIGHO2_12_FULL_42_13]|nr:MAG: 2-C-methyl-D-erythritol 4-phosphate cytidylyltransferase [Gammaproteobacteria bacterium RIFCSPHIGHO2_12_FULL_42_13]